MRNITHVSNLITTRSTFVPILQVDLSEQCIILKEVCTLWLGVAKTSGINLDNTTDQSIHTSINATNQNRQHQSSFSSNYIDVLSIHKNGYGEE